MRALLPLLLLMACAEAPVVDLSGREPAADPLPDLPVVDLETRDGQPWLRIFNRRLLDMEDRITRVPAGEHVILLFNDVPGADVKVHGLDLRREAAALWLRGRGAAYHWLPQHTTGSVNGGVQEDWRVDLDPGVYVLSETLDGKSDVLWLVE